MSSDESDDQSNQSKPIVDNSSTMINKIASLYAERLMSDVVLVVGNVEYPSHRLILCASSDVFQIMLMNPNWTESQETRVVLKETPSGEAVFEDFLKYMYTGKIQFDYATVIPLVSLADKYNVKDLLRIGLDYMTRNVSTACKRNQVVSWFQFTNAAGHLNVADPCKEFIKNNFANISQNIDFPNMEVSYLTNFIYMTDLVIEDELTLFKCVVDKWLVAQQETMQKLGEENISIHIDRYVNLLIPCIRFPMMTPAQLADLLLNQIATTHMEMLVDKIRLAMAFHKDQLSPSEIKNLDPKLFTPRLYTREKNCAPLCVDKLLNVQSYHCQSLLFSSQKYWAECLGDVQSEWMVDVYPKGVWIQKCLTVYQPSAVEVPGRVLKTVRVTISSTSEQEQRVKVGILLTGCQDGFQHVRKVITKNFFFSGQDQILNFDDVLSFDELNNMKQRSNFLSGSDRDTLQVNIVIVPLTKYSSLDLC